MNHLKLSLLGRKQNRNDDLTRKTMNLLVLTIFSFALRISQLFAIWNPSLLLPLDRAQLLFSDCEFPKSISSYFHFMHNYICVGVTYCLIISEQNLKHTNVHGWTKNICRCLCLSSYIAIYPVSILNLAVYLCFFQNGCSPA